jgi:hypothetical protein
VHDKFSDSAGVPWEGRSFEQNSFAEDSGDTPSALLPVLADRPVDKVALVAALSGSRLLIPLIAELGEGEIGPNGLKVDKSADLGIVAVATPDKQTAIPAFTSVADLTAWNSQARPVPASSAKVCLAAASEGHTRVILNPASSAIALRRPQLAAIAQGLFWEPPHRSAPVRELVLLATKKHLMISSVDLFDGDPESSLAAAELTIQLGFKPGLQQEALKEILLALASDLQAPEFLELVDSFGFRLVVTN